MAKDPRNSVNLLSPVSHFSGLCSENPHVANIAQSSQNCMSRYIDDSLVNIVDFIAIYACLNYIKD